MLSECIKPWTYYDVSVRALSSDGFNGIRTHLPVVTLESGAVIIMHGYRNRNIDRLQFTSHFIIVPDAVANLTEYSITSTSIVVSFTEPYALTGTLTGFSIVCMLGNSIVSNTTVAPFETNPMQQLISMMSTGPKEHVVVVSNALLPDTL